MQTWTEDWDVLFLDERRIPGIARVEVNARGNPDVQKARGKKGARVRDQGLPPAELEIEIEIDPSEMNDLSAAMNTLRPRGKTKPQNYLTIRHPAAKFYGIYNVVIGDMGSPRIAPGGSFFLNLTAIEHVENPTTVKKAKPAASDDAEGWAGLQGRIDELNNATRPSQAVEQNFTAPEDITNFSAQSGSNIFVPEPNMSGS